MMKRGAKLRIGPLRVRVFSHDVRRHVVYVYGWRDVVAWPVTVESIRRAVIE